jgi:FKBP-type peptidyl-prolyl cis-trans isomerase SlpA
MSDVIREIVPGSRVSLHLRISLTDGTEAISTFGDEPLNIVMGEGHLQPGLELALYGLTAGDTEQLTLDAEQAYGLHDEQLVHQVPISDFPPDLQPERHQVIGFSVPNGEETPGTVLAVEGDQVTVDFNHPLAGHDILFEAKILSVGLPDPTAADDFA